MSQGAVREKVLKAQNIDELDHIFETDGIFELLIEVILTSYPIRRITTEKARYEHYMDNVHIELNHSLFPL